MEQGKAGNKSFWYIHSPHPSPLTPHPSPLTLTVDFCRFKNDEGIGITSLAWDLRGRGKGGDLLAFADTEGYVGVFEKVSPSSEGGGGGGEVEGVESDPLVDDSLLMEVCS